MDPCHVSIAARLAGMCVTLSVLIATASTTALADSEQLAYGQHLASECMTCHRKDGSEQGIPRIVGLEPRYFFDTMNFYKTGARSNPAMVSVAKSLDDSQLKALAAYLATLKPAEMRGKGGATSK